MRIKTTSKKHLRVKKVTLKRKRYCYINPIVRLWLVFIGKRDSKKTIHSTEVFPFVDFEKSKISKYSYKVLYMFDRKTMSLFALLNEKLTMLEQQLYIVKELIKRLENKPCPEEIVISNNEDLPEKIKQMLDVTRISEKDLEKTAIRFRRFREYQQNLLPVRNELFNEMQKLLIIYQDLCFYATNIDGIHSQAILLIKQYISYINMRISLYRRGWMTNKTSLDKMPELIDADNFPLPMPKRTIHVDEKIKEIIHDYEKIINS